MLAKPRDARRCPNLRNPMQVRGTTRMDSLEKIRKDHFEMNSRKKDEKPLKASHERFAAEIANGASGVAAARAAFPNQNEASATSTAHRLLKRPEIRERIQRRIEEAASLTSNEIIGTLAAQMRSDPMEIFEGLDNPIIARITEKKLGHLIKSMTIKRSSKVPATQRWCPR